jgi:hypothetical protein
VTYGIRLFLRLCYSSCNLFTSRSHRHRLFLVSLCLKANVRRFPRLQVATACFSCSPPDLNFLDPYFIFMYMHYNHCHRATAHLQLNILLLLLLLFNYEMLGETHKSLVDTENVATTSRFILIVVLPCMLTITQSLLQQNAHFYY